MSAAAIFHTVLAAYAAGMMKVQSVVVILPALSVVMITSAACAAGMMAACRTAFGIYKPAVWIIVRVVQEKQLTNYR